MAGGLLSRLPKCRLILICCVSFIAALGTTTLGAGEAHAAVSPVADARFGTPGGAPASAVGVPRQMASITDNCSNPSSYPKFGAICVTGSSWAPAALVAVDPLHLDVFSNGPTTNIVGPNKGFGPEWQCTELAVRWAAAAWGEGKYAAWKHADPGWNGAAQGMWGVGPNLTHPLQQVPNGSPQPPRFGDLLIFHERNGVTGPGHVAIVLGVNRLTGKLTFIGENQYRAPAVFHVPISPTNHVSVTGFSSTLFVKGWLSPGNASTGWAIQSAPNVPSPGLQSVSCTSANNCEAVDGGERYGGSGNAQHWDGSSWTAQAIASAGTAGLAAVSCPAANLCEAVGQDPGGAVAEQWNGSAWSLQAVPGTSAGGALMGVSCTSSVFCEAVGLTNNAASGIFAVYWNGSTWADQAMPDPAGSTGAEINNVSCSSGSFCQAVGDYFDAQGNAFALAESWNGTTWTADIVPTPAGAQASVLNGVSCPTASACEAVGYYVDSTGVYVPMALGWNGTSWSQQPAPSGLGTDQVYCAVASSCESVGISPASMSTAAQWNGQNWTVQHTPDPPNTRYVRLLGVSCLGSSPCEAVGYYLPTGSNSAKTLAMRYS